jgi:outer membrane protein TolC
VQLATVNKAKQDYRLENYRLYPSVALHGTGDYVTDISNDAHVLIGGVTVNIPIFDFGAQLNTVRARRDTYAAERARLGAVGNDLASDLVKVYRAIYEASESILRLEGEAGKLDRDLRVAQSQQQQGIAPPLTAIDAELALVSKQEELEIDRARLLLRYAELQKAMGGTWKWIP